VAIEQLQYNPDYQICSLSMHLFRHVGNPAECLFTKSLCLYVCTKLKNNWMDFHEIWYWLILCKNYHLFNFCLHWTVLCNNHFTSRPTCVSAHISSIICKIYFGAKNILNITFRDETHFTFSMLLFVCLAVFNKLDLQISVFQSYLHQHG
jgi:hypothetical protein